MLGVVLRAGLSQVKQSIDYLCVTKHCLIIIGDFFMGTLE